MLKIALQNGNKAKIIQSASTLFLIDDPFFRKSEYSSEECYTILKTNIPENEWKDFVETLVKRALYEKKRDKYADICIQEGWTDRLMEFILKENDIRFLNHYASYLLPQYKDSVIKNFILHIYNLMENSYNRNRRTYESICYYLITYL